MAFKGKPSIELGSNGLYPYQFKGKLVEIEHAIVCPHEQVEFGWYCVVIGQKNPAHPVGGHNVLVFDHDLMNGRVLPVLSMSELIDIAAALNAADKKIGNRNHPIRERWAKLMEKFPTIDDTEYRKHIVELMRRNVKRQQEQ